MMRVVPGLPAAFLALMLSGCLRTSEVEVTLHIREAALASVDVFPARVLVDMGTTQNRELHICEWESSFLETTFDNSTYDRCPDPLTIEAVLVPLVGPCDEGAFRFTEDWPEPGTLLFGHGSIDVFQTGACNTIENRQLNLDAVE